MTVHRVGERYELGELLGRGGMAEVRKAVDVRLGRVVAVKRLRTDLASDPTFQTRFRREAQAAASLNHPAIVAVYDTGQENPTDRASAPAPYIVMEYVAGRSLREILREGRRILPERALEITAEVLAALEYSHRAGIIHRDIKPGNVMLTSSGAVKVMDFGIARALSDTSATITQTAAVIGTAQYLSPEQARGESVDARSDVYSTGCLLYELLTGRPPFVGENPVAVAYQHVREQPAPPSALDPDLPPEVDAIVLKALAKPPEDRYPSAAAMRSDIERHLSGQPVTAPVVPVDDQTAFLPGQSPPPAPSPLPIAAQPADERTKRWPLILLGALVLALLVGAVWLGPQLINPGPEQTSVPTLLNLTRPQASAALRDAGLTLNRVDRQASDDVPRGRVVSQDPQPGQTLAAGSAVDIVVSSGRRNVVVPYVLGQSRQQARQSLAASNLRSRFVRRQSDEPAGRVIATEPQAATPVTVGSLVTVFYSDGPEQVPSVVGMSQQEATAVLNRAGFDVSVSFDPDTPAERGTVLKQDPQALSPQPTGTTVVITVSSYERPAATPTRTPTPRQTPTPTPRQTPTPTPRQTPTPTPTPSPSPSPSPQPTMSPSAFAF